VRRAYATHFPRDPRDCREIPDAPAVIGEGGSNTASDSAGSVQIGGGNSAGDSVATVQTGPAETSPAVGLGGAGTTSPIASDEEAGGGTATFEPFVASSGPEAAPGVGGPETTSGVSTAEAPAPVDVRSVPVETARNPAASGDVLDVPNAFRRITRGELPFTGLLLALWALLALALMSAGTGVRVSARTS
jgi:hypothetical protein